MRHGEAAARFEPLGQRTQALLISFFSFCFLCFVYLFSFYERLAHFSSFPRSRVILGLLFTAIYAAVLSCLALERGKYAFSSVQLVFVAVSLAAVFAIRIALLDFISIDMQAFLLPWIDTLKPYHGLSGLAQYAGDYNMPYVYLLLVISKIKMPSLYLIKYVSVAFDFILAYYAMKLASLKLKNVYHLLVVFLGVLLLPTVVLNSAMWGQCDSIYAAFVFASFYNGLKGKSARCVIFFALSFLFKLQAVFFVPVLLALLIKRKIKLRAFLCFPVVFIVALIPGWIAGRPLAKMLWVYIKQSKTYPALVLNAPSVYQFFPGLPAGMWKALGDAGILLTGLVVWIILCFLYVKRDRLDTHALIFTAFLFSLLIPFCLPHMHERYFFLADAFSVVVVAYDRKFVIVAIGQVSISLTTYVSFLITSSGTVDYRLLTVITMLLVAAAALYLYKYLNSGRWTGVSVLS